MRLSDYLRGGTVYWAGSATRHPADARPHGLAPRHQGPVRQKVYRIGKDRSNNAVGVFLYCQQHAREWVTPITCLETAERLVRNYATDPTTKAYVDNLNIFILPSSNPDGGHYAFHDDSVQRKNMMNYCPITATTGGVGNRDAWGVDLNRNNTVGTLFDGYAGASTACTSETFTGPFGGLRAGDQERALGRGHVQGIKFANNIHTHGGYFMWAPGAYIASGPRDAAGAEHRHREVLLRGGGHDPVAHQAPRGTRRSCRSARARSPTCSTRRPATRPTSNYYKRGIIAYSFEAGAQRISVNPTTGAITQHQRRLPAVLRRAGHQRRPGRDLRHRRRAEPAAGQRGPRLDDGVRRGQLRHDPGRARVLPGRRPPPQTTIEYSAAQTAGDPINFRFNWVDEPSVIYYTTDGSTPDEGRLRHPDRRRRAATTTRARAVRARC